MVSERKYGCLIPLFTTILGLLTTWILNDGIAEDKVDSLEDVWRRVDQCSGLLQCGWLIGSAYVQSTYNGLRYSADFARGLINVCVTLYTMSILASHWWPWANNARGQTTQNCIQNVLQASRQDPVAMVQASAPEMPPRKQDGEETPSNSPMPIVHNTEAVKTVGTWNQRIHERVFQKLDFEVPDRASRVRQLTRYFDEDDAFGGAALMAIRTICLQHLRGRPLSMTESQYSDVDWSAMWTDVKARFARMTLPTDDDDSAVDALKQIKREKDESWLMMLNRYHVVYSTQGQTISRAKAVDILLRKLDMELVKFLRSQSSKEDLTFEALFDIFRQYGGYEELTKTGGAEAKPRFPATKKPPPVCFACHKSGHIERDCPDKRVEKPSVSYRASDTAPSVPDDPHEHPKQQGAMTEKEPPTVGSRQQAVVQEQAQLQATSTGEELLTARACAFETRADEEGSRNGSGLLHVSAYLGTGVGGTKKFKLLVDTGATINLLPTKMVKKRAWPMSSSESVYVASYSGAVERTQGTVELNVALGRQERRLAFHVVNVVKEPILSLHGLADFGAVINCEKREIRFEDGATLLCATVHARHEAVQCKVVTEAEAREMVATVCPVGSEEISEEGDALWIEEDEERGVQPYRRDNVLYCPVGRSTVLPPGQVTGVQLPYHFINEDVHMAGTGNGSIVVIGGVRCRSHSPRVQLINLGRTAEQIGSKCGVVAIIVAESRRVLFRKVNGKTVEIRSKRHPTPVGRCNAATVEELTEEFPSVLHRGLGCVRHYVVEDAGVNQDAPWGKLRSNASSAAEKEILGPLVDDLVRLGIAEQVEQKPKVVTPMLTVAKGNGQRRLVHDFRLLNAVTDTVHNSALDRMRLLGSVPRCRYWTAVDLAKGYNQVKLDESIRGYFGFEYDSAWYQFARVPFGWVNSGAHFQNALAITLNRVRPRLPPHVFLAVYVDDILIGAQTESDHDAAARVLMEELASDGWTINPEKMRYRKDAIEFLGHRFGPEGVRPADGLLQKIGDLPRPANRNELRSFFGLMVQIEKFSYTQHLVVDELRKYLQSPPEDFQTPEFAAVWHRTVAQACNQVWTLDYFETGKELMMMVDASGGGVGAALFCGNRPIAMFSRKSQQQWAHSSDTEIDGILKALEAFEMWIAGKPIRVLTDNWSAYRALNYRNLGKPVMRRLAQILAHNPNVEFVAGKDNTLADMLSRDKYLLQGTGERVTVVEDLGSTIRKIHEEGHVGVGAIVQIMKRREIKCKGMYREARKVVDECPTCQRWQKRYPQEDLGFNEAKEISEVVGIDFVGPLKNIRGRRSRHMVVMIDGLSRFVETLPVAECTSSSAIKALRQWQSEHGPIRCLISDAGSCFASRDFAVFCKENGVEHRMAGPGHQSSNGLAERAIQTLMDRVKKTAYHEGKNWSQVWHRAVDGYNSTPHSITRFAPRELRHGETEGGWLDEDNLAMARRQAIQRTAAARQQWQKTRQSVMRHQNLQVGDEVLKYEPGGDKFAAQWVGPYTVVDNPHRRLYKIKLIGGSRAERLLVHGDDLTRVRAQGSVSEMGAVETDDSSQRIKMAEVESQSDDWT